MLRTLLCNLGAPLCRPPHSGASPADLLRRPLRTLADPGGGTEPEADVTRPEADVTESEANATGSEADVTEPEADVAQRPMSLLHTLAKLYDQISI